VTMIYHITTRDESLEARQTGEYRAESLSNEGFIHLSGIHQVQDVANNFYTGQRGLVLLVVDVSRLKAELKYEPPVHPRTSASAPSIDQLFPHLYGPLNFDAVVAVYDFEPNPDGKFSLPAGLTTNN
jgi:uncharacterized protein (DUF952 family)